MDVTGWYNGPPTRGLKTDEPIRIPSKCHKRDDTSTRLEGVTDKIRQGQTDNEGIRGIHKYPQIHVHYT